MITFRFNKKTYETKVEGHANFDKKGHDIVCASVSTAILISSNLIKKIKEEEYVEIKLKEGFFHLRVKELTPTIKAILDNLIWSLEQLEQQYPKYIKYQKER